MTIAIINYGVGNLGSVRNMLKRVGLEAEITSDPAQVAEAEKIILPGVGAFDYAMERLDASGLRDVLDRKALEERVPVLGICLGMQMLTNGSEEGRRPGLGWIPARATRFPTDGGLKVPHMGWNLVSRPRPSALTEGFEDDTRFYFVHSYAVAVEQEGDSILKCRYGVSFDAAINRGNIYGAQFHPEKSHRFGKRLLANFGAL
jgi:glutamine amidotransferase